MNDRIKKILEKILNISLEQYKDADIKPSNIETWDSLNHLNIVLSLEEEFDVKFETDEILEMLKDFTTIVDILKKHGVDD
ncbi:hypothetical protein [Sporanaerobacter acetigenes]|uniref:hypothetical protein n=1 Tax=Sporanaerobacter acetigenes TaxID=165813 RepID=UPI0033216776